MGSRQQRAHYVLQVTRRNDGDRRQAPSIHIQSLGGLRGPRRRSSSQDSRGQECEAGSQAGLKEGCSGRKGSGFHGRYRSHQERERVKRSGAHCSHRGQSPVRRRPGNVRSDFQEHQGEPAEWMNRFRSSSEWFAWRTSSPKHDRYRLEACTLSTSETFITSCRRSSSSSSTTATLPKLPLRRTSSSRWKCTASRSQQKAGSR